MIALVTNEANDSILLGRNPKYRPGMFTCLSGFVEPCETVEDAVRREVFEEAGILVGRVDMWSSQPWPVGRSGSCELMLACIARAAGSMAIKIDKSEMEDVRWFSRNEARDAFDRSKVYASARHVPPDADVWIPGEYAIAHHLIKQWVFGE